MEKKTIITFSREFGSGGSEIAYLLAQRLGIPYYDKEIINETAKQFNMSYEEMHEESKKVSGSFLFSIVQNPAIAVNHYVGFDTESLNDRIYNAQADYIRKVAEESSCVIVGRCADYLLYKEARLVRVFIRADEEYRLKRIMERGELSEDKAKSLMKKNDKRRETYYNFHTNQEWKSSVNYDLTINVAKTGTEGAINAICAYIEALG